MKLLVLLYSVVLLDLSGTTRVSRQNGQWTSGQNDLFPYAYPCPVL